MEMAIFIPVYSETAIGCVLVLASLPSLGERVTPFCGTIGAAKTTEKNRR
jgi:hypothetical protein